jgi:hypothetical protein
MRGNWKEYNKQTDKEPTFLYIDGENIIYDKSHYYIRSEAKNLMDKSTYIIGDKALLYKALRNYNKSICKKYMMIEYHIDTTNIDAPIIQHFFDGRRYFLLKPISGMLGKGIEPFNDYTKMHKYVTNYVQTHKDTVVSRGWVLAEYINNPLLFNGKKFHMRAYYMVYHDDKLGKMRGFIFKQLPIAVAKLPFVLSDFGNKDIHDTHFNGVYDTFFPTDTTTLFTAQQVEMIWEKLCIMFYHVLQISDAKCYQENKKCYHVYGADIMITTDLELKLLEINSYIGLCSEPYCQQFNKYFLESQFETVVDSWFPPAKPVPKRDGFIEVTNWINHSTIHGGDYYKKYIQYKKRYKEERKRD